MTCTLELLLCEVDGRTDELEVEIDQVILIGYSGRDRAAVDEHIRELERLGVAPPPRVPAIYLVPPDLVTTAAAIEVRGAETSGEAEFVLLPGPDGVLIGAGSDHTDRQHEALDVSAAKALCAKVMSRAVWRESALESHWDALELRAWTTDQRGRTLYQAGRLDALLRPLDLLAEVERAGLSTTRSLIFSGTLATIGGFIYSSRFEVELRDPVLKRRLGCAYDIRCN
ncbi:MAG TPA: DUF2848 family protein [Chloroflexota bacterium]